MDCLQCAKFIGCDECIDRGLLGCEEWEDDPKAHKLNLELFKARYNSDEKGIKEARVKLFRLYCGRLECLISIAFLATLWPVG